MLIVYLEMLALFIWKMTVIITVVIFILSCYDQAFKWSILTDPIKRSCCVNLEVTHFEVQIGVCNDEI